MSKKRFVEFYLSAMMRAATAGRVTRLGYIYYDLTHVEIVTLYFTHDHGEGRLELPVTGMTLLELASEITRRAQEHLHD